MKSTMVVVNMAMKSNMFCEKINKLVNTVVV